MALSRVWYLVLFDKLGCNEPRCILDDFIDPLAVSKTLCSLTVIEHGLSLSLVRLLIPSHSHNQIHALEKLLGLLQGSGVPVVKEVVDPIAVDANGSVCGRSVGGEVGIGVRVVVCSECDGFLGGEAGFVGGGKVLSGVVFFLVAICRH